MHEINQFLPPRGGAFWLPLLPVQSSELWDVTFLLQQAKTVCPPGKQHTRLALLSKICFTAFTPAWENSRNAISYKLLSAVISYPAPRGTQMESTNSATPQRPQGRKIPPILSKLP